MAIASTYYFKDYISVSRSGEISGSGANPYFWFQPSNAKFSDNTWATLATNGFGGFTKNGVTPYLAGYGISNDISGIPSDATVEGLILRIEKVPATGYPSGGYPGKIDIYDDLIQLFNNGQMIGNNKSTNTLWNSSETYASYGSPNDTWGATLTPSVLNNGGFGVSIGATVDVNTSLIYNNVTGIDHVELTVFYSQPGGGQTIYPPPGFTQEKLGQHKLIRNIHHRSISDRDVLGRPALSRLIKANSIQSSEKISIPSLNRIIQPRSIVSQELLRNNNRLSTAANINPRPIKSEELITRNIKFFNRFYDRIDDYNVWETQSDTGDFTWDNTYLWEFRSNAKSLRRIGSPSRSNKFSTSSYNFIFYTTDTLYFSGFVYLANSPNYGGLGFCIQEDLNAGYYAVIDTRNGSGGSSTHSFRLIKVTRSGGTNTFTNLATYNLSGLISEDLWYRIIIEVTSSGNITAKLYKDNGSTLVTAATLSATDTTFTQGYYGLTAFSEAGFDNLTNVTAQFSNIDQSIYTQEKINNPQLNIGSATINLNNRSIVSQEKIGTPRSEIYIKQIPIFKPFSSSIHNLSPGNVNITSGTILSKELINNRSNMTYAGLIYNMIMKFEGKEPIHNLNPGGVNIFQNPTFKSGYFTQHKIISIISPSTMFKSFSSSDNKVISNITVRNMFDNSIIKNQSLTRAINPNILISEERIQNHKLIINIQPYSLNKSASFGGLNKLNSAAYISVNSMFKSEFTINHKLVPLTYFIKPSSINSFERLLRNAITTIISHKSIISNELIKNHSLISNIHVTRLFKNPYTMGYHDLSSVKIIYPKILNSGELVSINNFSILTRTINPYVFNSLEKLSLQSLVSNIYPKSIIDDQAKFLKLNNVKASNSINPQSIIDLDLIGVNILLPGVAFIKPNEVLDIHRMGQLVTLSTDLIIFQNTLFDLLDGYQPPLTEGPIGNHILIATNDIFPGPIDSDEYISPIDNIIAIAFISPYPILDPDFTYDTELKYSNPTTLQPDPFPGTINGWYVLPYTIESHLNFRKTS